MIVETPIDNFVKKLKFNKTIYPQCSCGNCSKFYWNALFVGSRASGKTYSCNQLIKHYESNKILNKDGEITKLRTFLISPTIEQNEIFNCLNSLDDKDKHPNYTDQVLLDIIYDIQKVKNEIEDYNEYVKIYKEFLKIKGEEDLDKFSLDDLQLLEKFDYSHYDDIPQPRYKVPPVNIVILDDLIGSDCFTKKSKNVFSNALIKSRHLNIAFCILVQNLKSTPKVVRLNCNLFWLGKFANLNTIIEDFYPEISSIVSEKEFEELYKYATEKQYGSLIIDFTKDKQRAFNMGWDTALSIK